VHEIERIARLAFSTAAKEAKDQGLPNVVARDGWIIRIEADGSEHKIKEIEKPTKVKKRIYYMR
jgi:hypothetical protein